MKFCRFLKKQMKPVLGIDITSSTVKVLELSKVDGRHKVESYMVRALPLGTVVEKNINNVEVLGETIRKVIAQAKPRAKDAAVAVAGSAVITKVIEMPFDLSEQGMEIQLSLEADQYIPHALDDVALDFEVLGPSGSNAEQLDVLLAACRRENVDLRVEALLSAGLNPKIVDVEVFAVERAFTLIVEHIEGLGEQVVAIVDIGATMLTLSVLVEGKTLYTREQLFGGRQVTEEIQRRYGLSFEEAGQAKKQGGLPEGYEAEVVEPFKDALIQQISRSLQFFFSSSQYNRVDQLVLAGGVAATEGLRDEVEEKLGLPVIIANPFANMVIGSKVNAAALAMDASAMMIATGLALRSFE